MSENALKSRSTEFEWRLTSAGAHTKDGRPQLLSTEIWSVFDKDGKWLGNLSWYIERPSFYGAPKPYKWLYWLYRAETVIPKNIAIGEVDNLTVEEAKRICESILILGFDLRGEKS